MISWLLGQIGSICLAMGILARLHVYLVKIVIMAQLNLCDTRIPMKHTSKVRFGLNALFYMKAGTKRMEGPINVRSFDFFCFISVVWSDTTYFALSHCMVSYCFIPQFFGSCYNNLAGLGQSAVWLFRTSRFSCHASSFHSHFPDGARPRQVKLSACLA